MKLGQRTLHNAVFNTLSSFFPLALSLILWPYIVNHLGEAAYGVYALVGTVIGYFALLDLGLGNAVIKYVAECNGRNDLEGARKVIGTAMTFFLVLGLAGLLLILATARLLATRWMKIPPELIEPAYYAFCASSVGFFFTMLVTLYNAIVNGLNRYDLSSIINALMGGVTTLGTAAVLYLGGGLLAVVLFNVAIPIGTMLAYAVAIRRLLPALRTAPVWDMASMKHIVGFGMYAMLSRVTDVIVRQVDLLLIGALLGVSAVTYYVIPFTILNRLTSLIGRIGMVIFPAVSELQGQQRLEVIERLYLTSSRVIFLLATACCLPVFLFGTRFLELWMSPEFAHEGGPALQLITLAVYADLLTNVPSFVTDGLGRPKITGVAAFSGALVFIGLMVPLARWMGITGVALAYLVSTVAIAPPFILYVHRRLLHIPVLRLVAEAYLKPLLAGALVGVLFMLVPEQATRHLWWLLCWMGACVLAYFLAALLLGAFQQHERDVVMEYAQQLLKRFRRDK